MVQNSLNPQISPASESEVGYGQLFAVFVRRFPWFLTVLITSIALAGLVTFKTKPTYKSSMQLLVEPNYQGKTEGAGLDNQFTDSNVVIDTATQLNLMQSSGLIQKAVDKLQSDYPDISSTEIKASLVLTQLRSKEDNVATKIFQVEYTAGDPEKTQKVLGAIRQVYVEYNKEQQNSRLQKGLQIIREQLSKASEEVNASETNLQRFRRNQN
ncbi:MAG: Wzz/FepE/Etk N-terminal domain-containing protein, partial [Nostoc sp.]